MLRVPSPVCAKAMAVGADAWLEALPELVTEISTDWSLRVTDTFDGGTEALVAAVELEDGTPAVLKLPIPSGEVRHEATTLRLAAGEGCVRLLRYDESRQALLLERLGRSLHELRLPLRARHEILCATAQRVWRRAAGRGLPTGADKGRRLAGWIATAWEETGRPCSERVVEHALACAERRIATHDDARAVLVHGDVHEWNALRAAEAFKLVDPDGLLAEPEYDLGILMREDPVELMTGDPRERARWLANRTGLSETAVWEWGVVERVSTGLLATNVGLQPAGRDMLGAADAVAQMA
jgi:streptomycin 6-kinase